MLSEGCSQEIVAARLRAFREMSSTQTVRETSADASSDGQLQSKSQPGSQSLGTNRTRLEAFRALAVDDEEDEYVQEELSDDDQTYVSSRVSAGVFAELVQCAESSLVPGRKKLRASRPSKRAGIEA